MINRFGWALWIVLGALCMLTACDGEGQACATDLDCPQTHYCAGGGGVFFSNAHCVARSLDELDEPDVEVDAGNVGTRDVGGGTDIDIGKNENTCSKPEDCGLEPGTNYRGFCDHNQRCDYSEGMCGEGFVDEDEDSDNGCECEIATSPNGCLPVEPILDGPRANVVFVSISHGSSNNNGLHPDQAVQSITTGIAIAAEHKRAFVLVSGGDFHEFVPLKDGIHIYGGYDAENGWIRDQDAQQTRILANSKAEGQGPGNFKRVTASRLEKRTILDGLTIVGPNSSTPGASTYAVWAYEARDLVIQNARIVAGNAAHGANGADGGAMSCLSGAGGIGGMSDRNLYPCHYDFIPDDHISHGRDGGEGSSFNGESAQGGKGGKGGVDQCGSNNAVTSDGERGAHGKQGAAGTNGRIALSYGAFDESGEWVSFRGLEATHGGFGGGGGGGGAGGSFEQNLGSRLIMGGNGGDGGQGGCAGSAGGNGTSGGSSFGIVLVNGHITVRDSTILQGRGGDGGLGGTGAPGQAGGVGAVGARGECSSPLHCNTKSGDGGDGGKGGHGGNGGHGASGYGGNSVGIALVNSGALADENVTFVSGLPGKGFVATESGNVWDLYGFSTEE